jgi:hypothetical protein
MTQPVLRRPNLPLTARDQADLEFIRSSPAFRRALHELAPSVGAPEGELLESVLLHAVFEAGLEAVRTRAEEAGYAELAVDYVFAEDQRRRTARRRRPAWADEA